MLRYQPTDEQLALAEELEDAFGKSLPVDRLHSRGYESEESWRELEALGIFQSVVPDARGGSGLGATEQSLIAIALGRALASPSILTTLGAYEACDTVAGAAGPLRIAMAVPDSIPTWVEEPSATHILVYGDAGATLHAMPATSSPRDDGIWGARLMTGDLQTPVKQLSYCEMQRIRLVKAAALAGIAEAAMASAVAYAGIRQQFGRPIGSFQAVKHHCANMAIASRSARDLATFAAVALDERRTDAAHVIESALLVSSRAAIENSGVNIQIHGGIGFSAEADAHLFVKRARLLVAAVGGIEGSADRVASTRNSLNPTENL